MVPVQTQVEDPLSDCRHQIASAIACWGDAWNAHDADALARLVAADVEFVNVAGRWLRGEKEFFEWHRMIHQTHLRESNWATKQYVLRRLRSDLALVHLEWAIGGERGPDGRPNQQRSGIFTWLVSQQDGSWRIAAAHNTNLAEGVFHRLSNAGP
jgi:uncharacterized protein (TIGR02246 family)